MVLETSREEHMYVITGATGNTGKRISELLLDEGKNVRVISRNRERLQPLVEKGAEPAVGSLTDEDFLTETFRGATAAYAMIPPDLQVENVREYQNKAGEVIAGALKKAGVKYVVHLSSLGADLTEGTGPIAGLHDQEERLNKLAEVNVLHLRPTFFMENFFNYIPLIKEQGINGSPIEADIPIPVIATTDIAKAAARHLIELDFSGHSVQELLGKEDLSMGRMTKILGNAIGKEDLQYIQFTYEDAEMAIIGMGISKDAARSFIELYRSINQKNLISGANRTEENTTETGFEEFAQVFADIYSRNQ